MRNITINDITYAHDIEAGTLSRINEAGETITLSVNHPAVAFHVK